MAINVQKSCSKEMDAILEEAKSAATQDARKVAYKTMQDLSLQEMDIVPLVNAWLLIAYAKQSARIHAVAHRLPEDAEGLLVRKLNRECRGVA